MIDRIQLPLDSRVPRPRAGVEPEVDPSGLVVLGRGVRGIEPPAAHDESTCSLIMSVKTPGTSYTWFGSPVTPTDTPATLRSKIWAAPDAPSHAARLLVYPKLAATG